MWTEYWKCEVFYKMGWELSEMAKPCNWLCQSSLMNMSRYAAVMTRPLLCMKMKCCKIVFCWDIRF